MNYKNDEEADGILSFFPSIYIREDERKHLKFTKEYIFNYFSEISKKNIINKYEDAFINLSILEKNELSDNTPVIRCETARKKSLFKKRVPTLEEFIYPIIVPELRLKLEKNFLDFELIRTINQNTHIARMVSTYQLTLIPEREIYDKKTFFLIMVFFIIFARQYLITYIHLKKNLFSY